MPSLDSLEEAVYQMLRDGMAAAIMAENAQHDDGDTYQVPDIVTWARDIIPEQLTFSISELPRLAVAVYTFAPLYADPEDERAFQQNIVYGEAPVHVGALIAGETADAAHVRALRLVTAIEMLLRDHADDRMNGACSDWPYATEALVLPEMPAGEAGWVAEIQIDVPHVRLLKG